MICQLIKKYFELDVASVVSFLLEFALNLVLLAIHPSTFYHCLSCTQHPGSFVSLFQWSWGYSRVKPLTLESLINNLYVAACLL